VFLKRPEHELRELFGVREEGQRHVGHLQFARPVERSPPPVKTAATSISRYGRPADRGALGLMTTGPIYAI
jgi:hypothetical protein